MSQYIVSARKYRPQKFDEVVGQQHVTGTLKNALNKDQLAHALLFCGPRGIGKTTCARILAKALNCENPTEDHEPCNECSMCKALNENASFNITELDAASNNSVDNIRSLIDQIRIPPQTGDYRVFIIDEVHMLSSSAFNAFLKTLEEPPSYAVFILATTEKHKILPTILSRCQIYDFKRIQVKDIRDYLMYVADQENVDAEQDALHLIATKADGALRDALSIFDRIVSATGSNLTYEDVVDQLNILDYDYFFKMTDALIGEDIPTVYTIFDEIIQQGFQADHFINGLGSHLRDLLVAQYKGTQSILDLSEALQERYIQQAKTIDKSFLIRSLHIINTCDTQYQRARNKRLHVEMALNHICFSSRYGKKEITAGQTTPRTTKTQEKVESEESTTTGESTDNNRTHASKESTTEKKATSPSTDKSKEVKSEDVKNSEDRPEEEKDDEGTTDDSSSDAYETKEKSSSKQKGEENTAKVKKKGSSTVPKLSSIEELKKKASDRRKKRKENKEALNKENLNNFLKNWLNGLDTPSTVSAVKASKIKLEKEKTVKVAVGSRTDATIIKNDSGLLTALRSHFMESEIDINYVLSKKLQEKRQKEKPLSPKERLEKLRKENPKVEELQSKLDLEVDD